MFKRPAFADPKDMSARTDHVLMMEDAQGLIVPVKGKFSREFRPLDRDEGHFVLYFTVFEPANQTVRYDLRPLLRYVQSVVSKGEIYHATFRKHKLRIESVRVEESSIRMKEKDISGVLMIIRTSATPL